MVRQPADRSLGGSWQWSRTAQTQRALLDAAREVFTEQGFTNASIADIVDRAGSSVGSLYHHFGGKSEIFIALYQEHQAAHEEAASKAVAAARLAGVTDRAELFCVGARAFLDGSWRRRDLALLFFTGDGPPGFELIKRRRGHEWIGQNDALLRLPDTSFDRLYTAILTAVIGEGAREVAAAKTRRQANLIIDAVIEYVRRLMAEGTARPDDRPDPGAQVGGCAPAGTAAVRWPAAPRSPRDRRQPSRPAAWSRAAGAAVPWTVAETPHQRSGTLTRLPAARRS
jgi:AcrR family transcriptional regulator